MSPVINSDPHTDRFGLYFTDNMALLFGLCDLFLLEAEDQKQKNISHVTEGKTGLQIEHIVTTGNLDFVSIIAEQRNLTPETFW